MSFCYRLTRKFKTVQKSADMYTYLNGVIISIGIFLLVVILLGNFEDTLAIKEEVQLEATPGEVLDYLTDINKFKDWYPHADSVYVDSIDSGLWIIESMYRDKELKTHLRVKSDSTSVDYKMWTAAYNSRTEISFAEKENSTILHSRTIIRGRSIILSGINKLRYFSSRKRIRQGYERLKLSIADK